MSFTSSHSFPEPGSPSDVNPKPSCWAATLLWLPVVQNKRAISSSRWKHPNFRPMRALISLSTMIGPEMGYRLSLSQWASGLGVFPGTGWKEPFLLPCKTNRVLPNQQGAHGEPSPPVTENKTSREGSGRDRERGTFLKTSFKLPHLAMPEASPGHFILTTKEISLMPLGWFDFSLYHLQSK